MYDRRTFLRRSGALAAGTFALPALLDEVPDANSSSGPPAIAGAHGSGPDLPLVRAVELQPLLAQVQRLVAATEYLGHPFRPADKRTLDASATGADAVMAIQRVLDRYCLFGMVIHPGAAPVVALGPAKPELVEGGWRQFLVKVHNAAGVETGLRAVSAQALPLAGSPADELSVALARPHDVRPPTAHGEPERPRARIPHPSALQP